MAEIRRTLAIWVFICKRNAYLPRMSVVEKSSWHRWLWLLAGIAAVALVWPLDGRVDAALDVGRNMVLRRLAWWCSKFGEGWVVALVGTVLSAVFLVVNRPQRAAKIFFIVLTAEFTGGVATLLRVLTGRTRPNNLEVPQGFYGVWHAGHWIIGQAKFSAFPSGHAATAVGLAAAAWLWHRGWGAVAAAYALAVMWSRIALQAHHLSDVVASVVLAIPLALWLKPLLLPSVEFQFGNLHRARRRK
jgi:membrane-associated phospholipid phosphatase